MQKSKCQGSATGTAEFELWFITFSTTDGRCEIKLNTKTDSKEALAKSQLKSASLIQPSYSMFTISYIYLLVLNTSHTICERSLENMY